MTTGHRTLDLDDPQVMAEFTRSLREAVANEIREQVLPILRDVDRAIMAHEARRHVDDPR